MSPTQTVPTAEVIVQKKKVYNLDTCEKFTKENKVTFQPFTAENVIAGALEKLGGDKGKLTDLINDAFRRDILMDRSSIPLAENECPVGIVNMFTKNYLPMFSKEKDKATQRAKAIGFVRGLPQLMDALKTFAQSVMAEGSDVPDDEDGEDGK